MAHGIIMADIQGTTLDDSDKALLACPEVGGMILFARNVKTPAQVRALTDAMRAVNGEVLIAVDQEGGRVARFRDGFSPLPAMGKLGALYDTDSQLALSVAYDCGYLMAAEVLAVGVDFSFAPVLDIDGASLVIGDRAFHTKPDVITLLASRFMDGMHDAGMATTGKHFPGHGSIAPDSHVADAIDERSFAEIFGLDMQPFIDSLSQLDALMPAHVIFSQVDDKPAGFSSVWIHEIIRDKLKFDGVLFSDDLCMKAAHVAGGVPERVAAAIDAGCDMALVCNNREGALAAIEKARSMDKLAHQRFSRMKGAIPAWRGSLEATCAVFPRWADARANVAKVFFSDAITADEKDPTNYTV